MPEIKRICKSSLYESSEIFSKQYFTHQITVIIYFCNED